MEKTDSKREAMGQDEEKGQKSKDFWQMPFVLTPIWRGVGVRHRKKGRSSFRNQENMMYMLAPVRI
jgi:hypothetical protein